MLTLVGAAAATAGDVFERMDRGPAEQRWRQLKSQYLSPAKTAPQPVVEAVRPPRQVAIPVRPISDLRPLTPVDATPTLSDSLGRWRPSPLPGGPSEFALPLALQDDEESVEVSPLEDLLNEAKDDARESLSEEDADADSDPDDGESDDADAGDEPEPPTIRERIAEATKLTPLSTIVPSFDYAPAGEERCTYLCPRPLDCPGKDNRATRCPDPAQLPMQGQTVRVFAPTTYAWAASNLSYNPLYFEDADLERYGHLYPEWVQPFASGGLFAVQVAALPYQMAIDPPCACVTPLGFHRPGDCVPTQKKAIPWNPRAAVKAAGVYTGLIFLVP